MTKELVFDVRGMTCDNCVRHVTQAVQGVEGVRDVRVELASASARVSGDFEERSIIAAIEEEGYEASVRA
jgi:copper chaperone